MSYIPTALHTDLYQLTMAYGYWKRGLTNHEAAFHLFYRKAPFGGSYAITAGLDQVIHWLNQFSFQEDELAYLHRLKGNNGAPLFEEDFLKFLGNMRFGCHIHAMPEGTLAFPHEPILRVTGPLIQAQLIETALLNMINFQTLIATKSSRITQAAAGDPVLEFGLRRAQGTDGAHSASRAAYIGGCVGTSNVEAGKKFGIPIKGTHAHSWVMAFDSEMEAFESYAAAMPNNCIFLVDTYDSIAGVHK
ncbi:MAG: nicotinate phosphoribosyltransferase, partial [Bacteroidota bacterium]